LTFISTNVTIKLNIIRFCIRLDLIKKEHTKKKEFANGLDGQRCHIGQIVLLAQVSEE